VSSGSLAPIPADTAPAATLADVKAAAGKDVKEGQHVRLETTQGPVELVLFPEAAPKAVENFVKLAGQGYYDGVTFHRVINDFMAQGGDPNSKSKPAGDPTIGSGGPGYTIPDEHGNGLKHLRGSLAMAHTSMPNSAGSQFYICFKTTSFLDGDYTVFGQVVAGMDAIDKLARTEGGRPAGVTPDKITKMVLIQ
jgi:cyclophilin family peptidyl-prolyl cis-trans isomerase